MNTIKLTTTQAIVKYLANQFIEIAGKKQRIVSGGFGIFGHGNVTCLGEALFEAREELPLFRGQNEQSMALAAVGYAKYYLRKRCMFATSSAGPGTTNLLTASALAHANRLPLLMLCGDTFNTRLPDPVLQQVENFSDPSISVNDSFKPVTRYWDRITTPSQVLHSLPHALNTLLDPADCGPAFIGLPQDVQGFAYDFPESFFEPQLHRIRRQRADRHEIQAAAQCLLSASKPVIIAGGGVQYSEGWEELASFAQSFGIPVVETIAGRANMLHSHQLNAGPLGTTGSNSANNLVAKADVVLAVGTRLQDFTTGSWSVFSDSARIIQVNVGRFDATKHNSLAVVGDAKLALQDLHEALSDYHSSPDWQAQVQQQRQNWQEYVALNTSPNESFISYAQVVKAVNDASTEQDRVVTAAGGLPAEVCANWQTKAIGSVDIEFGYSCMGYEIAGAWGAKIAQDECQESGETFVLVGDGSYLMMNSDIYSSVLTGKKLIIVVCDNGGFAVINKLQKNTGNQPYNNLIEDCKIAVEPFAIDFVKHARAMGAEAQEVDSITSLHTALAQARQASKTSVILIQCHAHLGWTDQGHAWWEVGIPEVSTRPQVNEAFQKLQQDKQNQRKGV